MGRWVHKSAKYYREFDRSVNLSKVVAKLIANQSGQAGILIGMMTLTFLFFFQFVVNTGLLVNAKINLQNAADLAAYAGASVQARQMNNIAYLNYEMRRQYKKFLFRYYVLGGAAQVSAPNKILQDGGRRKWTPDGKLDYTVPTVCIIFNGNDNYCQVPATESITVPDANPLDPISTALKKVLENIEEVRDNHCSRVQELNKMTLQMWLLNPTRTSEGILQLLEEAKAKGGDGKLLTALQTVQGLTQGIGLIPKNILLIQRIKTLGKYLNLEAQGGSKTVGITIDDAQDLQSSFDVSKRERPIQAFFSAYNTLGSAIFDDESIELQELLPPGGQGANLIRLEAITTAFQTYFINLKRFPENAGPTEKRTCIATPEAIEVNNFPVGVFKDPEVRTYYAILLKAKASLMFSPFGTMELKAYSAAQPFGSRIGPKFVANDVARDRGTFWVTPGGVPNAACGSDCVIPNLQILSNDRGGGKDLGWHRGETLAAMYNALNVENGVIGNLVGGYDAAMSPNPSERALYNIPNDVGAEEDDPAHQDGGDPFIHHFDKQLVHAFWAPVIPPEENADLRDVVDDFLEDAVQDKAFRDVLLQGFNEYFSELAQGAGEGSEGLNIARIKDPLRTLATEIRNGVPVPVAQPVALQDPDIAMRSQQDIKTSWNDVRNSLLKVLGRGGYSVKYVTFDSLSQGKSGGEEFGNVLVPTPATEADIFGLKH